MVNTSCASRTPLSGCRPTDNNCSRTPCAACTNDMEIRIGVPDSLHKPSRRAASFTAGPITVKSSAYVAVHSRDVTFAVFCQGPYEESARYRDVMGWEIPWYSAQDSLDTLLAGRRVGLMHIVCYLRQGSKVFETYWTTIRGVEAMDNSYRLLDLTVYGRQETWEDSPTGWPQRFINGHGGQFRTDGRPIPQWSRLKAGYSDDLGTGRR